MRRAIAVRRQYQAFGRGSFRLLYPKNRKVLAYLREHDGNILLCVANVCADAAGGGDGPLGVRWPRPDRTGRRIGISADRAAHLLLTLPPYGFYWFYLAEEEAGWPSNAHARSRADARISDHHHARASRRCAARDARAAGAGSAAGVSRQAALVRDEGPDAIGRCAWRRSSPLPHPAQESCWRRSKRAHRPARHGGCCLWRWHGRNGRPARCRRSWLWRVFAVVGALVC